MRLSFVPCSFYIGVSLLYLWFGYFVDRGWPIHPLQGFSQVAEPGSDALSLPTSVAPFCVYLPTSRQVTFSARVVTSANPADLSFNAKVNGKSISVPRRRLKGTDLKLPLHLAAGLSRIEIGFIPQSRVAGNDLPEIRFSLADPSLTASIFNWKNLLFAGTWLILLTSSVLVARLLGVSQLDFCTFVPLTAFFIITTTGTLLSVAHSLNGPWWAGGIMTVSLMVVFVAFWRSRVLFRSQSAACSVAIGRIEQIVILLAVLPISICQAIQPVKEFDDLMYHGSRAGYWLTNASALPFFSHNDRLSVFPIGGDLLFALGVAITHAEAAGKFLVFLAYPLILFAMLSILRRAEVSRWTALSITLIFGVCPIVWSSAVGLKPDLWVVFFSLVALDWTLVAFRDPNRSMLASALATCGICAAIGVKWTAVPLLLLLGLLVLIRNQRSKRLILVFSCVILGISLGGAGPALVTNLRHFHHPFGSQAMRDGHTPDQDKGFHPAWVQLKRLPFLLAGFPRFPNEKSRAWFEEKIQSIATRIGATERLTMEGDGPWPGLYQPSVPMQDSRFSLAWIFILVVTIAGAVVGSLKLKGKPGLLFVLPFGLATVMLVSIATQTRWQTTAGLPERFLIPALALALVSIGGILDRWRADNRVFQVVAGALLSCHAIPSLLFFAVPFEALQATKWMSPANFSSDSEISSAARFLPPGRRILFFGEQGSRDYPLFCAREGFPNQVFSWGKKLAASDLLEEAIDQNNIDTVIFAKSDFLNMNWDPEIDIRPCLAVMESNAKFTKVVGAFPQVIYARKMR